VIWSGSRSLLLIAIARERFLSHLNRSRQGSGQGMQTSANPCQLARRSMRVAKTSIRLQILPLIYFLIRRITCARVSRRRAAPSADRRTHHMRARARVSVYKGDASNPSTDRDAGNQRMKARLTLATLRTEHSFRVSCDVVEVAIGPVG
jgi:hypothetical protein